jgi:hypothetical protein
MWESPSIRDSVHTVCTSSVVRTGLRHSEEEEEDDDDDEEEEEIRKRSLTASPERHSKL